MPFDSLRTFVTLVEVKNFTKTAETLRISQPSVSLHIKNLEAELDTQLILRSPKQLQVTPTGEILYERAKQIIHMYEQTKQDILAHHQAIRGSLKIGASLTIGEHILPALLYELNQTYPELELDVRIGNTDEIVEEVRLYHVDIGLIEGQTNVKELVVHPFMQDELYLVAGNHHPLANKKALTILDLQNQVWVTREQGSGTGEFLAHVIRSNGLKVASTVTISSNQAIKETVMQGLGLSLLSKSVIEREVQSGHVCILPLSGSTFKRTFSCVYSPIMVEKQNVKAFLQVLEDKWR